MQISKCNVISGYDQTDSDLFAERPYNSRRLGKEMADDLWTTQKKCIFIRISPKNKQIRQTSYKLHGHTLDNVDASKYLGVAINNNLSWDRLIDNIVGKRNKTLGFIRRNIKDYTKPVKSAAYTVMVIFVILLKSFVIVSCRNCIHRG